MNWQKNRFEYFEILKNLPIFLLHTSNISYEKLKLKLN